MPPFLRNFSWQILLNLIASAIGAAAMLVGDLAFSNIPGCPQATREDLVRGEAALLAGRAEEAHTIASDLLALAPSCKTATALRARANLMLKQQAESEGQTALAKHRRSECYKDAAGIYRNGDPPPLIQAVRNGCKA